jgi:lipopolysaccharide transport system permease protein
MLIGCESSLRAGLRDWWNGTCNFELWGTLAWYDVMLRYRRSMLGPLWLTISTGAMLIGMGPLYSMLLGVPIDKFFPHLTLGIIFWGFLTGSINDGCGIFFNGAQYLKQPGFPALALVWRGLARNIIQLAHTIILYIPVVLWFHVPINSRAFLFIPGIIVVIINLQAAMITLGVITARFRDVAQIVSSVLTLMMFITPVFWFPDVLPERAKFMLYNPFAQWLAIIRLPLLGSYPAPGTVKYMILFTGLNLAIAAIVWAAARRRLAYWV